MAELVRCGMKTVRKAILILCILLVITPGCDSEVKKATVLYQLPTQTPQQMMSYVIITKEGNCIVIDGGNTGDSDYLLQFIKEKTKQKKPVIDAWFFSHVHSDHVNGFIRLVEMNRDEFTVKKVLYNFPRREFINRYDYSNATVGTLDSFNNAIEKLKDTEVVTLQKGDKFSVGSAEFEVLLVQDEEAGFMKNSNVVNNSNAIFRMTVEGQTVLFLGDAGVEQGNALLEEYGDELKSDMVQMAHHGQNGVNENVYKAINPRVCLWPTPDWLYDNNNGGGYDSGPWKTIVVREWMEDLGVKHHFVDKDGLHEIKFPFELD